MFSLVTVESKGIEKWPVRSSLFPNVPPYIAFAAHDAQQNVLPPGVGRFLKWRLSTITPVIVRKTLQNTGFRLVKSESQTGVHALISIFFLSLILSRII